jgi:hypothetical protein
MDDVGFSQYDHVPFCFGCFSIILSFCPRTNFLRSLRDLSLRPTTGMGRSNVASSGYLTSIRCIPLIALLLSTTAQKHFLILDSQSYGSITCSPH